MRKRLHELTSPLHSGGETETDDVIDIWDALLPLHTDGKLADLIREHAGRVEGTDSVLLCVGLLLGLGYSPVRAVKLAAQLPQED